MRGQYLLFYALTAYGATLRLSRAHWLFIWVGLEVRLIGFIGLMCWGAGTVSNESCMKYYLVQSFSRALLLFRGLYLFNLNESDFLFFSLFISGVVLKLGLFPGHWWVTPIYRGITYTQIGLARTIMKVAPFWLIYNCASIDHQVSVNFLWISGVTILVGAILGLQTNQVRQILAASTISHGGWIILGLITGGGWLYFFLYSHSLVYLLLWLHLDRLRDAVGAILRIRGLPPFALFFGKLGVISYAIQFGVPVLVLAGGIVRAVLSLRYYLKYSFLFSESGPTQSRGWGGIIIIFWRVCVGVLAYWVFFFCGWDRR